MNMELCPITLREARAFVNSHHRHHRAPQGGLFAVAISKADKIVGVAIIGRPVARLSADGYTAEVTRVCVLEGIKNGCSMLYGAAWRAARALGYRRLITFTMTSESGVSLRASGWKLVGKSSGGSWSRKSRPRVDLHPLQEKLKWKREVSRESG